MTSKLVVNTIEADTGISSVSFASSISMDSTSKFHFSAAGVDIGADTNINRPASGVLGFNVNGAEKVRIDSSGHMHGVGVITATHFYGDGSNLTGISAGTSLSGSTNNTVCTVTGANAIQGEANLTFDGTNLRLGTTTAAIGGGTGIMVASSTGARIKLCDSDAGVTANDGFEIIAGNGGTGYINNKENQAIVISTNNTERMRVTHEGSVGIGTNNSTYELEVHDGTGAAALRMKDGANNVICDLIANSTGGLLRTTYNHPLVFHINQVEKMRIDTNGNCTVNDGNLVIGTAGHGIDFSNDANGSMTNSEVLDDYEEGYYYPAAYGTSSTTSAYYYSSENKLGYIKIGKLVTIMGRLRLQAVNFSGGLRMTLPYAAVQGSNTSNSQMAAVGTHGVNFATASGNGHDMGLFIEIFPDTSYADFIICKDNQSWINATNSNIQANNYLAFNLSYVTND